VIRRRPAARATPLLLTGRRVVVRSARPSDRAAYGALLRASAAHLAPWEPRHRDPTGRLRFDKLLAARADPSVVRALIVRRRDGELLGQANLNQIVRGVAQSASLGYWLGGAHVGQGYMSEALGLLMRHAFRTLKLHRLEINVMPRNGRSRRVARRLGFRLEGRSPGFLKIAGRWEDHMRYALLATAWRARPRGAAPLR
jgi:ribosomal-protein-alanine N-acetyltransferase